MRGLDPRIRQLFTSVFREDGRVKPGHAGIGVWWPALRKGIKKWREPRPGNEGQKFNISPLDSIPYLSL
jgi:hypothetical protein